MDNKNWKQISICTDYEINENGDIKNIKTSKYSTPYIKYYTKKNNLGENKKGYLHVSLNKKDYSLHRLLAITFINNPNNYPFVDHIDGDTLNNNLSNLRWCTREQNNYNSHCYPNNELGVKGVQFRKDCNKYRARIRYKTKLINIGNYNTVEEAKDAYNNKAKELFGEFANFGEI